jgi:hypothetical protein
MIENIKKEMRTYNGFCKNHNKNKELFCKNCRILVCTNCHFKFKVH